MFFRNSSPFQGQQQTLRLHLPQTHLPPQPATSHTDDTPHTHTHTHTASQTRSWPHLPGSARVLRRPSFIRPPDVSQGKSFVLRTRCGEVSARLRPRKPPARGTGVPERGASSRVLLKSTGINAGFIFHVPPAERRSPGRKNICLPFMRSAVIPRNSLCWPRHILFMFHQQPVLWGCSRRKSKPRCIIRLATYTQGWCNW